MLSNHHVVDEVQVGQVLDERNVHRMLEMTCHVISW